MDKLRETVQLGSQVAAQVAKLLEHATEWEAIRVEMSTCADLTEVLPDVAIFCSD